MGVSVDVRKKVRKPVENPGKYTNTQTRALLITRTQAKETKGKTYRSVSLVRIGPSLRDDLGVLLGKVRVIPGPLPLHVRGLFRRDFSGFHLLWVDWTRKGFRT